jgi:hypothetical protein
VITQENIRVSDVGQIQDDDQSVSVAVQWLDVQWFAVVVLKFGEVADVIVVLMWESKAGID